MVAIGFIGGNGLPGTIGGLLLSLGIFSLRNTTALASPIRFYLAIVDRCTVPRWNHGKACGIRTHVFEEGYFRPYWVTLEREGVNGYSLLPRDPDWFREVGAQLPHYGDGQPFQSSFADRAAHDVAFHMAGFWNPLFFPRYRTHAPVNAVVEYVGYVRRLPLLRLHRSRDNALVEALVLARTPFFVLPLQLSADAQIRDHSRFKDMLEVIEFVMASFARHASAEAKLVIKNHPLDLGLINYSRVIRRLAARFDVAGRVEYMETGDLDTMLRHARGTVTVNSTVGALSLALNCPTIALSDPIYNLPGLTCQGKLDDFWQDGTKTGCWSCSTTSAIRSFIPRR